MKKHKSAKDWGALLCLVVFWGSSFAITKLALESMTAEWIVFLRLLVSTFILIPIVFILGGGLPHNKIIWIWYAGLAVVGCLLPFLFITHGLNVIDSSLGAILIGTTPLFVLVFAHLFLKDERMNRRKLIGFLIGFLGIIALMNPETLLKFSLHLDKLIGQGALLASAILYAAHMVATRFLKGSEPLQTMTGMSIIACILSFFYALWVSPSGMSQVTNEAVIYVILLGVFPTAIAGVILYHMVRETGARFVSLSNYLLPIVALIIGTVFLDEKLQIWMLIGMGLIFVGIWISEFRSRKE